LPSEQRHLSLLFAELLGRHPGTPVVHEGLRTRSLCFGMFGVQTAMRKSDPFALHLPYTRAMMAFQLFQPDPAHIVIVGLGGGSLSKYCHRRFPEALVTTIEIDERVIALRDQFQIPDDSARFRVVHADAAAYLAGLRDAADAVLLDGFDAFGLPASLSSQRFYDDCHAALRDQGVLVANLLERSAHATVCLDRIGSAFGGRPLWTHARRDGNPIAIAVKHAPPPDWPTLHARARDLALSGELDFGAHAKNMERNHRVAATPAPSAAVDPVSAAHD
jgi:spermidine synthase